jgi:hypothetical protein
MLAPHRVITALMVIVPAGCASNAVTGVSDVKWSRSLSSDIVYGSVASGTAAIPADVPPAHVRACVDGVVKGLSQQETVADVRAARRLAPMSENLTREMVRLLRDTGATFLSVEKNVFRMAVSNTRPYTFSCRTPFGTASFTLDRRWTGASAAGEL